MSSEHRAAGNTRPTLARIAAAGDVSVPTVSKVLNGRPDVADDTRRRIERLLREHHYVAQSSHRGLLRSRTVGLLLDDVVNAFSAEIVRGVTDAGWESGIDVIVGRLDHRDPESGRDSVSWATRMDRAGRDGVVLVTPWPDDDLARFAHDGLPIVLIDPLHLVHDDVPSIGATNWTGGRSAAEHLVGLGHRRVGFVGGPADAACSQARHHGLQSVLEEAGLGLDPSLVAHGDFYYPLAHELGLAMLQRPDRPTAVFAANDETAVGVMRAAHALGLDVPGDLSVVGFDDTSVAAWSIPPLTTVRAPLRKMGRVALRTLLQLVDGDEPDAHHVQLATTLVVRESTAPPATDVVPA